MGIGARRVGFVMMLAGSPAACSTYGSADTPPDIDAGRNDLDASRSNVDASDASSVPASSTDAQVVKAPYVPPSSPVGIGCEERAPKPQVCHDYETGVPPNYFASGGADLAVASGGSSSAKALRCTFAGTVDGFAYVRVETAGARSEVAFSFDLAASGEFVDKTQLFSLQLPHGGHLNILTVHFDSTKGVVRLEEYREEPTSRADVVRVTGKFPKGSWLNIFVRADLESGIVTLMTTSADGTVTREDAPTHDAPFREAPSIYAGISYQEQTSGTAVVLTDNFAAYWR